MIDLRKYFPDSSTVVLNNSAGQPHARYTFSRAPDGFLPLFDAYLKVPKAGHHYVWRKEYFVDNLLWRTATYGILQICDDGSVIEVGDWLHLGNGSFGVFGYRHDDGSNAGLIWCPPGGLTGEAQYDEMSTISQAYSGAALTQNGSRCYSESGLIDVIPSMTVGGKTYAGVVHMVMYHGVQIPGRVPVKAGRLPLVANGVYYRNRSDWDEYAIELWLAPGVGIIRERTPWIENASWWNLPDFSGDLFGTPGVWVTEVAA
jgi:hypothetical protein